MDGKNIMPNLCLNLVLLGKPGAGKRSIGNTILRRQAFTSEKSFTSVTQEFVGEVGEVCGLPVTVYDTPGFSGTESEEQIQKYEEVLQKCESDLCAFLIVLQPGRFTEDDEETLEKIEDLLGEKRIKNTWILFTDKLEDENMTINELINQNDSLKKLIQKYEGKCHMFNNKYIEKRDDQMKSLISNVFHRNNENLSKTAHQRIPINIQDIPVDSRLSRRIVLLGKSGVGKSAAGNTILGQKVFKSARRMNSVTNKCSDAHATVSGRSVSVVDTPGFFDTQMKTEPLVKEIMRSVYLSSPGPHAFLIVFRVIDRFTEQEEQIPQIIEMLFGQEVLKYSMILFTHGDQLDGDSVEELIKENKALSHLVQQCGDRYHVFDTKDENNRKQVNDLLKKIDTMIEQNGGGHYSNQMFEDALRFRKDEDERIQREKEERTQQEEKQRQEEIERVKKETEKRIRAEMEAQNKSELEKLQADRQRDDEQRKQEEEKRREEEIEKVRKEMEERIRAEENGFLKFMSKYWHHILIGAVVGGLVVGGVAAVAGGAAAVVKGGAVGAAAGAVGTAVYRYINQ